MAPNPDTTPASGSSGFLGLLAGRGLEPFSGDVVFEDVEVAEKPFAPHYDEFVRPHVQRFEADRIVALGSLRTRSFVVAAVIVVLCGLGIAAFEILGLDWLNEYDIELLVLVAVVVGGVLVWAWIPVATYQSAVKSTVYPAILSFFGEDFRYQEEGPLSARDLQASGIIPSFDDEKREDYFAGTWNGVRLELTECKLTEEQETGGQETGDSRRTTVTKFRGLLVLLSMNKRFSGITIVRKDAGKVFNWLTGKIDSKLQTVRLEDPVFEDRFEVYSSDQVEARFLLTPSFMERLLTLSASFGNAKLECSFFDEKLLLMIESHEDRFETSSIFEPATFVAEANTLLRQLPVFFDIIGILKLDQRTGL